MATVLVVDDSPIDRRLVGSILEKISGTKTEYAGDGAEALLKIERSPPDVVLTDLQMPKMDGLELVSTVRSRFPLVPVILMTGHGSEDIAVQALQRGAASYVNKSSISDELSRCLRTPLHIAGPIPASELGRVSSPRTITDIRILSQTQQAVYPWSITVSSWSAACDCATKPGESAWESRWKKRCSTRCITATSNSHPRRCTMPAAVCWNPTGQT